MIHSVRFVVVSIASSLILVSFVIALTGLYGGIAGDLRRREATHAPELNHLQLSLTQHREQHQRLSEQVRQLEISLLQRSPGVRLPENASAQHKPPQAGLEHTHKLAVIVPFRDREQHLAKLLRLLHAYLTAQGTTFNIFVIEQSPLYLFNRGQLLNIGVQLLQGSDYDYFVFHDVDTIPRNKSGIQYSYPKGNAPLHLTPYRIHPAANFQDFFGGITIFTREQYSRVNGYGNKFWGWGREDDNMRHRLMQQGMFPPELPKVSKHRNRHWYFEHQHHDKSLEWRTKGKGSGREYFGVNPNVPYDDAQIMSAQPDLLLETSSGLNSTHYWINSVQSAGPAVKYTVEVYCNQTETPWCSEQA